MGPAMGAQFAHGVHKIICVYSLTGLCITWALLLVKEIFNSKTSKNPTRLFNECAHKNLIIEGNSEISGFFIIIIVSLPLVAVPLGHETRDHTAQMANYLPVPTTA